MAQPVDFRVGDVLTLKKPHPCGGFQWQVVRVGMDIGIRCLMCGRRVLLPRRDLERRLRARTPAEAALSISPSKKPIQKP